MPTATFVKVFDAKEFFDALRKEQKSDSIQLDPLQQELLISRFDLLETLLSQAAPLLSRSGRIISSQSTIPHLIEGSLDSLRIQIEDALEKIATP